MCLIVFAYHVHPKYKLILAANRDESYARPSAPVSWWKDHPEILGGRDLKDQGTWMAIRKNGRFAAITNYREVNNVKAKAQSRGDLPVNFLLSDQPSEAFALKTQKSAVAYNGFNLLAMDSKMVYMNNYNHEIKPLDAGIFGLSNALLDTPWHKVTQAKQAFSECLQHDFILETLIELMQDKATALDKQLPKTGLDYKREKALSAIHISTPEYGTCCSTVMTIDHDDNVEFMEKSYPVGDRKENTTYFNFTIDRKA